MIKLTYIFFAMFFLFFYPIRDSLFIFICNFKKSAYCTGNISSFNIFPLRMQTRLLVCVVSQPKNKVLIPTIIVNQGKCDVYRCDFKVQYLVMITKLSF